ncbi:hypothetical protein [Arthrobacter sp. ok362]|uniref:hypothetical protein n=1 Tax=Arthrobacter sp. ok362 TaxID=1761745 RepID=UPI000AA0EA12|nr:hypothetical protein [Arthrobacter sp. ok362]
MGEQQVAAKADLGKSEPPTRGLSLGVFLASMAVLTLIALFVSKETRDLDYENNVA